MFARPSSQDFRVDMLATSSSTSGNNSESNQQFHRLNHHPSQHLPPHSAPSLPGLGIGSFEPHNPFIDRGPLGLDTRPRPPPMSLGFEPQMDFYSQRLRQLAEPPVLLQRRLLPESPPHLSHPPMSSSSQPSTPTSTPQPVLNLHSSTSGNGTPSHQHNNSTNNNPAHRGSSASSTSSKGGGNTDAAEGSLNCSNPGHASFVAKPSGSKAIS
ncbi:hypothetical protein CEXT_261211 [Caerostris extrusa]|uniref:Uncharacterized protein n=1 Tax=Caerostris extrusa TaxID=172846 RepID=A0AAV4U0D1_CAEEX|nr:hypothetical protein CEXT_261211 [Caerostris extrusa]